jgi:hypothetical protein
MSKFLFHLFWFLPIVGWSCIGFFFGANVRARFDSGHILWIRSSQIGIRAKFVVQANESAILHQLVAHLVVFVFRASAPVHSVRFAQLSHGFDPRQKIFVVRWWFLLFDVQSFPQDFNLSLQSIWNSGPN